MVILLLNFIFQVCGCCGLLCSATEHDQSEGKPLPDVLHQCTGGHGCLHCSGLHCQKVGCCLLNFLTWKTLGYLLCTGIRIEFFYDEFWKQDLILLTFWIFPHSCRCQRRIPLLVFFVIGGVACIIAGIIPFICKTTNCTYFSFTNTSIIIYIGYKFIVVLSFHFFGVFFMLLKVWKFSLAKHLILQWKTRICEGRLSRLLPLLENLEPVEYLVWPSFTLLSYIQQSLGKWCHSHSYL